jgi:hydrogenase maturation protease
VTTTIVIGYGNTLRRDDGAGVAAAERLARDFPGANVRTAQELHPELAEQLASCDLAVFLDASVRTSTLCVTRVSPARSVHGAEGHALSPAGVLALCSGLYGHAPQEALLVEIPASECGFGETMSAQTLRMTDYCVLLISELLTGETTAGILLDLAPSPAAG